MKVLKLLVYFICVQIVSGCVPVLPVAKLILVQDPQEGAMVLQKITSGDDNVSYGLSQVPSSIDISPDGEWIAFSKASPNAYLDIYLKNTKTPGSVQRTFWSYNELHPSFSPDGSQIAFSGVQGNNWNIYLIGSLSGQAVRQITTLSGNSHGFRPQFSPSGDEIAFVSLTWGQVATNVWSFIDPYIWTYNLENGALTQLTRGTHPSYSPDGKNLVFSREEGENTQSIWTLNLANGSETLIYGEKDVVCITPKFSPDGKTIAFVSTKGTKYVMGKERQNFNIFLINIDGTNLRQLTFHQADDFSPVWSKDGKFIYFLSGRGSREMKLNIWRMQLK